jgi:hypothetical protein
MRREPAVGDEIVVAGPGSSAPNLHGTVLEILGKPGCGLLRVRWSNGTITVYTPAPALREGHRAP